MQNKFVVAIGSSMGGIEPMLSFFDSTHHDFATYIILRHLPFDYKSQLQAILQRHSKLKIVEAQNDTLIERDTVYTVPGEMYMTIKKDSLYLQKRKEATLHPNWSVDVFLRSLAEVKGERCIAIILSGIGSDGSHGAALIKKAGGMVIVQDPESCDQPSMPLSTIKTGVVDHILLPSEMPKVINHYVSCCIKNTNTEQD